MRPKQHGPKQHNLGISSPTKFVNHFYLFENLPTNHKEYPVSNKTFGEGSSRIKKKKRSKRIFEKYENAHAIISSAKERDLEFWVTSNKIIPSTLPTLTKEE